MLSFLRLQIKLYKGFWRRNFICFYCNAIETKTAIGMFFRLWGWLHNASKDADVPNKPNFKWKFVIGEEVEIKSSNPEKPKRIGMIEYRFIRFGRKYYEIKIGKWPYIYCESELAKSKMKVYANVKIQEIKFKSLREGHFCQPAKRPKYYYQPSLWSSIR